MVSGGRAMGQVVTDAATDVSVPLTAKGSASRLPTDG